MNIYAQREVYENSTTEDFSVVRQECTQQVRRKLKHYNLDTSKYSLIAGTSLVQYLMRDLIKSE